MLLRKILQKTTHRNTITSLLVALQCAGSALAINVNTGDEGELANALSGVGPKLAAAIVKYREANGPFASEHELMDVSGIGPVIVERNRDQLEFDVPEGQ